MHKDWNSFCNKQRGTIRIHTIAYYNNLYDWKLVSQVVNKLDLVTLPDSLNFHFNSNMSNRENRLKIRWTQWFPSSLYVTMKQM